MEVVDVETAAQAGDGVVSFAARCLLMVSDALAADAGGWSPLDRHGSPVGLVAYPRRRTLEEMASEHRRYVHALERGVRRSPPEEQEPRELATSADGTDHRAASTTGAPAPSWAALTFFSLGRPASQLWLIRNPEWGEITPSELRILRSFRRFIDEQLAEVVDGNRPGPVMAEDLRQSGLTEREREVVTLAATGATNAEIARTLVVSTATIKTHLYRAFSKLEIRNRAELAHRLMSEHLRSDGMPSSVTTGAVGVG